MAMTRGHNLIQHPVSPSRKVHAVSHPRHPVEHAVVGQLSRVGMWRSLVANLTGGQGVAGSNPVIPTIFNSVLRQVPPPRGACFCVRANAGLTKNNSLGPCFVSVECRGHAQPSPWARPAALALESPSVRLGCATWAV